MPTRIFRDDSGSSAVDAFAVADLDEAIALPKLTQPLLILRPSKTPSSVVSERKLIWRFATVVVDRRESNAAMTSRASQCPPASER